MPHEILPGDVARARIGARLRTAGWQVQDRDALARDAGPGSAGCEYPPDLGLAAYGLCAAWRAGGVIAAKPAS